MYDQINLFRDAILKMGLTPPDVIEPGKMYRFPGDGKGNGNTAGWCRLFDDGLGGCFGDWSTGLSENWRAKRDKPFSTLERAEFKRRANETQKLAELERQQQYADAAKEASAIMDNTKQLGNDFSYLIRKSIKANGARLYKDSLVIPIRSSYGEIQSLQFIASNGSKRFLTGGKVSGGYYSIGTIKSAEALCIAEGFATGATIHEATGYPVAVAFNAGNLESVALAMREKLPELPIIICADDDSNTKGNPGLYKAKKAAFTIGAKVAIPDFQDQNSKELTDFNDMEALFGSEEVANIIKSSAQSDQVNITETEWPDPIPLTSIISREEYPLDALPETIRTAIEEVHSFVKAPIVMIASSALAALSLAIQAHTDVKRAEKLSGPVGLFLLTIADSGERKSTCDGFFMQAIREYEADRKDAGKPLIKDHKAEHEAWEAIRGGIKDKIRSNAKSGKSSEDQIAELQELEHNKPEPPRIPHLIYGDETPESLKWNLAKDWPSGGVISSEAGLVFGSHGMGKDSVMRNLATLNQLWDGAEISTGRRSTESFTVRGARLTIALQVQEPTLRIFFERSGGLARGTGFLARFLLAWPESTQGSRSFTDPPENWPALEVFNERITEILNQSVPIDEDGALSPPDLSLSVDTKALWIVFHDAIETELTCVGELYDVRDVASKTADNAVRLAALFQIFEHGVSDAVESPAFKGASRIAAWHLLEARRFYGELAIPEDQADAVLLENWLVTYCQNEKVKIVSRRDAQRLVVPIRLRQKKYLDIALEELVEARRIRLVQNGKRKEIQINPALLKVISQ